VVDTFRERRRRELFNKKRSRKELSRRLLSIDFSLLGQEEKKEEEESDEEDDIYLGITIYYTPYITVYFMCTSRSNYFLRFVEFTVHTDSDDEDFYTIIFQRAEHTK
jgi:hypothetical protein